MTPNKLTQWRFDHKLTQAEAAKMLGRSRQMISYYEGGYWQIPEDVANMCDVIDRQEREKGTR